MADWKKIEAEYITTETSYRKLAQKYGLNQATIAQKAKAEDWVGKRKQQASTAQALILEKDITKKVDRATRLKTVADKLLDKVEVLVERNDELSATAIKNLSDAIKNIKEAQMIRTQEDIEEQKARIAKLQKETEKQDNEKSSITITLEGSLSDYAQ
jgi:hypothetical protein